MKNILALIAGIGIGVAISWTYNKNKYEEMVQEEVESLRESKKEKVTQETMWKESMEAKKDKNVDINSQKEKEEFDKQLDGVKKIIDYNNYSQNPEAEEDKEIGDDKLMTIIKPDDFADQIGYDTDSFYIFADNIVTDENNEVITNVKETLGFTAEEIRNQFGVYENDAVYIRNPKLNMDYEVLRELETYQKRDGD